MKQKIFSAIAVALSLLFFSCEKMDLPASPALTAGAQGVNSNAEAQVGFVFTISNEAAGNRVLAYARAASGELSFYDDYVTGGTGTGGGLGSQGAIVLSDNGKFLIAVNAGSNNITSFRLKGKTIEWVSTVASGGTMPVSVDIENNLVYVLNAGGSGNVTGFTIDNSGMLHPIATSTRPLSSPSAGAAQVSFVQNGAAIVVTEKATNKIISYTINSDGTPGMMHMITAANPTPFGFAVARDGIIYVSEAAGGGANASTVSSYKVNSDGSIMLIEGPVSAGQTAACWVVVTNNEKYVYATNTGSNNVSSFMTDNSGALSVKQASAMGMDISVPIDAALSVNSKFLYVLNSGDESITGLWVNGDGSLQHLQNINGLPNGAAGLAAK